LGELFHHLSFARQQRHVHGLHPIAVEALVRGAPASVLGATVSFWPALEQSSAGFFQKLFRIGARDAARWESYFCDTKKNRMELIRCVLAAENFSPLQCTAFGLGALSSEILNTVFSAEDASRAPEEQAVIDRAKTRIWLRKSFSNPDKIQNEWRPILHFRAIDQKPEWPKFLNATFQSLYGSQPGTDLICRWIKSLIVHVEPLIDSSSMPIPGPVPDDEIAKKFLGGEDAFLEKVNQASSWFVFLAGRIANLYAKEDPSPGEIRNAFIDENGDLLKPVDDRNIEEEFSKWTKQIWDIRTQSIERGKNAVSAVSEKVLKAPGYNDLMDAANSESPMAQVPLPPTATQEISLGEIEMEFANGNQGEANYSEPPHLAPVNPVGNQEESARTQEISMHEIEMELTDDPTGATADALDEKRTQEISMAQIEGELSAPDLASNRPEDLSAKPNAYGAPPPTDPSGSEFTEEILTGEIEAVISEDVREESVADGLDDAVSEAEEPMPAPEMQSESAGNIDQVESAVEEEESDSVNAGGEAEPDSGASDANEMTHASEETEASAGSADDDNANDGAGASAVPQTDGADDSNTNAPETKHAGETPISNATGNTGELNAAAENEGSENTTEESRADNVDSKLSGDAAAAEPEPRDMATEDADAENEEK
jgi:hypothetical protein